MLDPASNAMDRVAWLLLGPVRWIMYAGGVSPPGLGVTALY